jgi:hypothetical protein
MGSRWGGAGPDVLGNEHFGGSVETDEAEWMGKTTFKTVIQARDDRA